MLPTDSIRQTGRLVLFTNPTAFVLLGMAVRVRMLSEMVRIRSSTFLVSGSCRLSLRRVTVLQLT